MHRESITSLMRVQYDGYRFVRTQKEALFNPQYVLYFLDHLEQYGVPPESLVDPAVSGPTDNVAEFLIANHKTSARYTLSNFALGLMRPEERDAFEREFVPAFYSAALFSEYTVSATLISLAYYHGFLTFKPDKDQRIVLTSPNIVMQTVYVRALFAGLPEERMDQVVAMICTAKPDLTEIKRIVLLGIEEATKALGKSTGEKLSRNFAKVFGNEKISA